MARPSLWCMPFFPTSSRLHITVRSCLMACHPYIFLHFYFLVVLCSSTVLLYASWLTIHSWLCRSIDALTYAVITQKKTTTSATAFNSAASYEGLSTYHRRAHCCGKQAQGNVRSQTHPILSVTQPTPARIAFTHDTLEKRPALGLVGSGLRAYKHKPSASVDLSYFRIVIVLQARHREDSSSCSQSAIVYTPNNGKSVEGVHVVQVSAGIKLQNHACRVSEFLFPTFNGGGSFTSDQFHQLFTVIVAISNQLPICSEFSTVS